MPTKTKVPVNVISEGRKDAKQLEKRGDTEITAVSEYSVVLAGEKGGKERERDWHAKRWAWALR